jgi:peptide-methionine (R)-S-oxide reductase
MATRRNFLATSSAALGVVAFGNLSTRSSPALARENFEIIKTKSEWKKTLTPAQYAILREWATERPFKNSLKGERSSLLKEARTGTYNCAGCALPVYPSNTKYDSGTGWPSFWAPIKGAVGTRLDKGWISTRTEVHCRRCGGHLGHVFNDGPAPTGKRHCLNGLSMTFTET